MNERERMLKKENTILIDLVQALVKALSEQMKMHQSLSELQKELFNKELEKCKIESLKCCGNCKHDNDTPTDTAEDHYCYDCENNNKWEKRL